MFRCLAESDIRLEYLAQDCAILTKFMHLSSSFSPQSHFLLSDGIRPGVSCGTNQFKLLGVRSQGHHYRRRRRQRWAHGITLIQRERERESESESERASSLSLARARALSLFLALSRSRSLSLSHTHTHKHARTHSHTHPHTHTGLPPPRFRGVLQHQAKKFKSQCPGTFVGRQVTIN
jgi:hypothetical protein